MAGEPMDVADGMWLWRTPHPDWTENAHWEREVTSVCAVCSDEVLVLDAVAPASDEVWGRLDARPPTVAVVLKPDHVRDVDLFVRRYGARPYGPWLFFRHDIPEAELEPVRPGDTLPGGAVALYDGRGRMETPVWLPDQRTIVFADALTERHGELRVWGAEAHEQRTVPALRELLKLPFERVIVSHGSPVHDRDAFERALELPAFEG